MHCFRLLFWLTQPRILLKCVFEFFFLQNTMFGIKKLGIYFDYRAWTYYRLFCFQTEGRGSHRQRKPYWILETRDILVLASGIFGFFSAGGREGAIRFSCFFFIFILNLSPPLQLRNKSRIQDGQSGLLLGVTRVVWFYIFSKLKNSEHSIFLMWY